MRFANPEAFLLLPLVPLALWWSLRPRRRGAARFSALGLAGRLPTGWAVVGPVVLAGLRAAGVALLVVALARPQTSDAREQTYANGIAVQLVIDNSYSMRNRDFDLGGESMSRLDAVKHAVRLFVAGGEKGLAGRPNDKVGVITFARDPDVVCPLTLDHQAVLDAVGGIGLAPPVGTNIGDALAWALDRLRHDPTKQKVVVLLTDGGHNIKEGMPPAEAAQLAADLGIKVYTIGAVGNRFNKPRTLADALREAQGRAAGDSVDEPLMEQMASRTGGRYYRAADADGLAKIYADIDRLEATRMEKTVHVSRREWFLAALLPALALLLAERALAATRLLRIP
ncbi:MAG TPA: VWA domain-containing protein [Gemmataceae bacterium]|nr:VWA domain-containing protein [Gemmataceae bacterium]